MKRTGLWVVLGIVAVLLILFGVSCGGYNGVVKKDEAVKNAWGNVQAEYQQRSDLVPNLVNTVKGAANFEQQTLENVIKARAQATSVQINPDDLNQENMAKFQQAQGQLSGALSRLLVTVEQYPQLQAVAGFRQLQTQLEGIENGIKDARKKYNDAVNTYNVSIRSFPMLMFRGMFGFKVRPNFEAD
ncbi:MAG TPA: LemA family protein, partial [Ferruginibacter sp.]|nr:LemA family protein [Ferruginibacter sp.]